MLHLARTAAAVRTASAVRNLDFALPLLDVNAYIMIPK